MIVKPDKSAARERSLHTLDMSSQQAKPSAAPAPKSSWATLAAASAALPSPKAPVPVKVTPRAPQPAKPAKKTANNAPATTSKKGKDKMKRDPSLPYDRGTPNYKPEKTNVVPTVKEVSETRFAALFFFCADKEKR